jgi:hypothetical protein
LVIYNLVDTKWQMVDALMKRLVAWRTDLQDSVGNFVDQVNWDAVVVVLDLVLVAVVGQAYSVVVEKAFALVNRFELVDVENIVVADKFVADALDQPDKWKDLSIIK